MAPSRQEAVERKVHPEEWVDVYGDFLFGYALTQLRDPAAAEEAVQETFLSAIRNFDQFDGSGPQAAWLIGILKRKIVDAIRARDKRASIESLSYNEAVFFDEAGQWDNMNLFTPAANAELEDSDFWEVVRECLASLPTDQSNVFVLRVMEQLSTAVICKELGISANNVWTRLHRARLNLAKCVALKLPRSFGTPP